MDDQLEHLQDPSGLLPQILLMLGALLLGLTAFRIGYKKGLFSLGSQEREPKATTPLDTLGAFGAYFILEMLVIPLFGVAVIYLLTGVVVLDGDSDPKLVSWINLVSITISAIVVMVFFLSRSRDVRLEVIGSFPITIKKVSDGFIRGGQYLLIAYPLVVFTSLFVSILLLLFVGPYEEEQVAVEQVKQAIAIPSIFPFYVVVLVGVVPFLEELLFRGFFHNLLRQYFTKTATIVLTTTFFASLHLSFTQGWKNVEIFFGLFVLSLFLGIAYEKTRSLWTPFAMHCIFNAINLGFLLR